jgi:hypothetical protein
MADFPIYHGITLAANAYIENFNVEQLASDPVPVAAGRAWFNTTDKVWKHSTLDATGAVVVRTFATAEALAADIATVTAALNAEIARATAAEATLTTNLAAEVTRATAAEATLTSNLATEVSRATAAEVALGARIDGLGNVFEYIGTVNGGADAANALDMETLAQKATGDYYKVATAGYFKVGAAGTPFYANLNDGLVFNSAAGVDKIDNTDSAVAGTTDYISVTGSTDTGFVVDVDAAFKARVSTLESGLAAELVTRAAADTALDTRVTTVEGQVNGKIGDLTTLTTSEKGTIVGSINSLKVDLTSEASTRSAADTTLQSNIDAEVAARTAADTAIRSDYNARRFTFSSASAATQHTVTHNLNSQFVDFTVWVQRADGSWRNDIVSVKATDANSMDVYLSSAANVRLSVTSMANI